MPSAETATAITGLLIKTIVIATKWAGQTRKRVLASITSMTADEKDKEILFLRQNNEELTTQVSILRKRIGKSAKSPRYSIKERLHVIWFLEYVQSPRRRVTEYCGIARSTLYRWLRTIDNACPTPPPPHNRTPNEIALLVWQIARANLTWGRIRIANQLGLLGVFLAASTVRNILSRPKPPTPAALEDKEAEPVAGFDPSQAIPASYPNHVWSIDRTLVSLWGLWPTYVLVAIDHFSRKIVAVVPLEGPNAGWVCDALEAAFRALGPPRHLISDHEGVFTGAAFSELLGKWHVKPRLGAVGKHGSIAVTERVIRTLKYEWLFRAPMIKGFDHLATLCVGFSDWYNGWRPHMRLAGARPDDVYCRDLPEPVDHDAKVLPLNIEKRHFAETRVTGFRLPRAA